MLAYTPPPVDATESRESRRLLAVEPRCDRSADDIAVGRCWYPACGLHKPLGRLSPVSLELVTTPNLFWKVQMVGSYDSSALKARQQLEVYV